MVAKQPIWNNSCIGVESKHTHLRVSTVNIIVLSNSRIAKLCDEMKLLHDCGKCKGKKGASHHRTENTTRPVHRNLWYHVTALKVFCSRHFTPTNDINVYEITDEIPRMRYCVLSVLHLSGAIFCLQHFCIYANYVIPTKKHKFQMGNK